MSKSRRHKSIDTCRYKQLKRHLQDDLQEYNLNLEEMVKLMNIIILDDNSYPCPNGEGEIFKIKKVKTDVTVEELLAAEHVKWRVS